MYSISLFLNIFQGDRHKFEELQGIFPLAVCGHDEAV